MEYLSIGQYAPNNELYQHKNTIVKLSDKYDPNNTNLYTNPTLNAF